MVVRALFLKEFRQIRVLLVLFFILNAFFLPYRIWSEYTGHQNMLKEYPEMSSASFVYPLGDDLLLILSSVFLFFIAIAQMGTERARGTMDYTLGLPFKRTEIYLVKSASVLIAILLSSLISLVLSGIYTETAGVALSEPLMDYYSELFFCLVMVYCLTFAAGSLTGTPFAQGLTALSTGSLPFLFTFVLFNHVEGLGLYSYVEMEKFINAGCLMTPFLPMMSWTFYKEITDGMPLYFLIQASMGVIFFTVGLVAFLHHPNERNGNFFLWKQLNLPVLLLVFVLGVLGFSSMGYHMSANGMTGLATGAAAGAAVSLLLGYFLIYKKTKHS
ncbi:hypothetical protein MHB63_13685 [Bacillus sp. FSL H8-0547]